MTPITEDPNSRVPPPPDSSSMPKAVPTRSRTDPSAPDVLSREKRQPHHRLHSHALRNRAFTSASKDHSYRHAAKDVVQSATELKPPISFDRLLRRDKDTPDSSRRGSGNPHHQQPQRQARDNGLDGTVNSLPRTREEERVRPQHLEKLKRQNALREEELRNSLEAVEDIAMSSTRQLDNTYYTILEKAAALRTIVSNLQQLAEETRKLHATFDADTSTIARDTKQSLDGFGNFDKQEASIDSLVKRLQTSKSQTGQLDERLEAARTRVEVFEQQERARQKTRRTRWQMSWAAMVGVVVLLIALVVARRRAAIGSRIHSAAKAVDDLASPVAALLHPTARADEDPFLKKLFDDL